LLFHDSHENFIRNSASDRYTDVEILSIIAHHGYLVVAGVMFLFCAGIPLPAAITLVAAGTASATHLLNPWVALTVALGGCMAADVLLFLGGRYTGWWLLGMLCRASLSPDKCMFRAANYFYDRGARTLLTAKFVPGVAMMAAPVAGSLNMRPWRFLIYDIFGVATYCGSYFVVGLIFHSFFLTIAHGLRVFGQFVGGILLVALAAYAIGLFLTAQRDKHHKVQTVTAQQLADRLATPDPERITIIADVRSHGYYERNMQRIQNSIRIEPNRLAEEMAVMTELLAPQCEVFVYCTCARDATSNRVAWMLQERGFHARVIRGGLRAWKKAGLATEPVPLGDLEHLPAFD
jgi:membrane protein DedA with SNARE-associated domain/rhodanese-related sulfurtransferase